MIPTITLIGILQNLFQSQVMILKVSWSFCRNLTVVEVILQRNIFIYDFDIQEGVYVEELARRSFGRFDETVKLLRFKNHIIDPIQKI